MPEPTAAGGFARLLGPDAVETLEVLGPRVQILTPPAEDDEAPCLLRGTIPPGGVIPIHSHRDFEVFAALSGAVEAVVEAPGGYRWMAVRAGEVLDVPGGAPHGFRNASDEPAVQFVLTTSRLARFFRETGRPVAPDAPPGGPPSAEELAAFLEASARYGHWLAPPEENARAGIVLPPAP